MKAVFTRSTRGVQLQFVVIAVVLFLSVWYLLELEWMWALVVSAAVAALWVIARVLFEGFRLSVTATEQGLAVRRGFERQQLSWSDVEDVQIGSIEVPLGSGDAAVHHAIVESRDGRRIAFADLSFVGHRRLETATDPPVPILDVGDPEVLLAIVSSRSDRRRVLDRVLADAGPALEGEPAGDGGGTGPGAPDRPKVDLPGLSAVVVKIGTKLGKVIGGFFKMVKPGFALASGTVYALIFDWKFAIGLMVMLLFHEYGHVHAMRRSGLPVRGIYFIPLLGAAAVSDGIWRTRAQQAYIALNGPFWGLLLTLPLFGASILFGQYHPVLPVMVAWWSLVNLFNLLPVSPLDGGRLLGALSHSLDSRIGIALSGAAFVAGMALAFWFEVYLFAVVGIFGLLEFVSEVQQARVTGRVRLAAVPDLSAEALLRLRLLVRPVFREEDEVRLQRQEMKRLGRMMALTRVAPMPWWQTILWGLFYLALLGSFIALVWWAADVPGADLAQEILR